MSDDLQRLSWILEEGVQIRDFHNPTPELKAFIKHLNNLAPAVYKICRTEDNGGEQSENSELIKEVIGTDNILKSTLEDAEKIIVELKALMENKR